MKTCTIETLNNNERMSTQELLQLINEKVSKGYDNFIINACGQHDIGCALFNNKKINLKIKNPGQRVGAMGLEGTTITVLGSTPADVGWLNSGAVITVLGDAGDTAAHCAAGGKIFVAGRVGARSGALMKHDPKYEEPQLWVLKNTGSFSFEFMGGGVAVVCGYDCSQSVLSNHACEGMVGGVIYARGKIEGLSSCVEIKKLDKNDEEFLIKGLEVFLDKIDKKEIKGELSKFSQWKKIVPKNKANEKEKITLSEFKKKHWFNNGLFSDLIEDDFCVYSLCEGGSAKLRKPLWDKKLCVKCDLCLNNCPYRAINKENNNYLSDDKKCIGCGICAAVCPKKAWNMEDNRKG